jgi:hypothetical protein
MAEWIHPPEWGAAGALRRYSGGISLSSLRADGLGGWMGGWVRGLGGWCAGARWPGEVGSGGGSEGGRLLVGARVRGGPRPELPCTLPCPLAPSATCQTHRSAPVWIGGSATYVKEASTRPPLLVLQPKETKPPQGPRKAHMLSKTTAAASRRALGAAAAADGLPNSMAASCTNRELASSSHGALGIAKAWRATLRRGACCFRPA